MDTRTRILEAVRAAFEGAGLFKVLEGTGAESRLKAAQGNIAQGWLGDIEYARNRAGLPTELCALLQQACMQHYHVQMQYRPESKDYFVTIDSVAAVSDPSVDAYEHTEAGAFAVRADGTVSYAYLDGVQLVHGTLGPDTRIDLVCGR